MSLFETKSLARIQAEAEGGEQHLKKTLGPVNLVALGIGAIIGAGLFSLTGIAAADHAGPAVVLSFVVAAIGCAFAGMCYSEFSTMIPIAGSAYTYAYATMGELLAWIIGWDLVLEYAVGAATVSVSWSSYVVKLFHTWGIELPPSLVHCPWDTIPGIINLPAVLVVVMISCLLMIGISESAKVNGVIVVIKVGIVLVVIGAGALFIQTANWHPFIPPNTGTFGEYGWSGILRGAGVIFFAYIGFDAVSTSAQEARDPQRDMPRGILGSLAICTVLFVLVSAVMVGVVPYKQMLNEPAPLVVAIQSAAGRAAGTPWAPLMNGLTILLTVGALAALSSVMVVMMLAQPRIFLAMANDGLLPRWAGVIHPRFKTPHISTIVTGVVVSLAAGLTPIATLGSLVSIGTLMAFVIVSIGVIVLRRTRPDLPRPFRMPMVPLLPILSAVIAFLLMLGLPRATWERLVIWMVVGIVIYFAYGYRRSRLRATDPFPKQIASIP